MLTGRNGDAAVTQTRPSPVISYLFLIDFETPSNVICIPCFRLSVLYGWSFRKKHSLLNCGYSVMEEGEGRRNAERHN